MIFSQTLERGDQPCGSGACFAVNSSVPILELGRGSRPVEGLLADEPARDRPNSGGASTTPTISNTITGITSSLGEPAEERYVWKAPEEGRLIKDEIGPERLILLIPAGHGGMIKDEILLRRLDRHTFAVPGP